MEINKSSCFLCYELISTHQSSTSSSSSNPNSWSSSLLRILNISEVHNPEIHAACFAPGTGLPTCCTQCLNLVSESMAIMTQVEELQRILARSAAVIEKRIIDGYRGTKPRRYAAGSGEGFSINECESDPINVLRNKLYEEIQYRHPADYELLPTATDEFGAVTCVKEVSVKEEENYIEFELVAISPDRFKSPSQEREEEDPLDLESLGSMEHESDEEWFPEYEDYEIDQKSDEDITNAETFDEAWQIVKPSNSTLQKMLTNPPSLLLERLTESSIQSILLKLKKSSRSSRKSSTCCPTCFKVFKSGAQANIHRIKNHIGNERPFQCKECPKNYKTRSNLQGHVTAIHTTSRQFECRQCPESFNRWKLFKAHVKSHKAPVTHKCDECGKCYTTSSHLKTHQLSKHSTGPDQYKCQKCNESFKVQRQLRYHVLNKCVMELGGPVSCEVCGKAFNSEGLLRRHVKTMHAKPLVRRFTCDTCAKSFSSKPHLRDHQRVHTGERPFICDTCGLTFTTAQYLRYHKLDKHEKSDSLVCSECNKRFTTHINLNLHLARVHRGDFKIRCTICNHGVSSNKHLKIHMETKHTTPSTPLLKCDHCEKTFTTQSYLTQHLKRHAKKFLNQRKHVCEFCDKGFLNNSDLNRHRAIHVNEKKFVCEVCGKAFPVKNYLYIHMKSHNRLNEGTWGWGFKKSESSN